jgi:2-amino-4-hydroxy-6-hydroxymethyldihydropteridine diphosphokinase
VPPVERIFLLLGSNLGDPIQNIYDAIVLVTKLVGPVVQTSSLFRTAPWGKEDQPWFTNQALELQTELSPSGLLELLLRIETTIGRQPSEKWGPRKIDIDILLYGKRLIREKGLCIPHPYLAERKFALVPLVEIAGEVIDPTSGKTIHNLLEICQDTHAVNLLGSESGDLH